MLVNLELECSDNDREAASAEPNRLQAKIMCICGCMANFLASSQPIPRLAPVISTFIGLLACCRYNPTNSRRDYLFIRKPYQRWPELINMSITLKQATENIDKQKNMAAVEKLFGGLSRREQLLLYAAAFRQSQYFVNSDKGRKVLGFRLKKAVYYAWLNTEFRIQADSPVVNKLNQQLQFWDLAVGSSVQKSETRQNNCRDVLVHGVFKNIIRCSYRILVQLIACTQLQLAEVKQSRNLYKQIFCQTQSKLESVIQFLLDLYTSNLETQPGAPQIGFFLQLYQKKVKFVKHFKKIKMQTLIQRFYKYGFCNFGVKFLAHYFQTSKDVSTTVKFLLLKLVAKGISSTRTYSLIQNQFQNKLQQLAQKLTDQQKRQVYTILRQAQRRFNEHMISRIKQQLQSRLKRTASTATIFQTDTPGSKTSKLRVQPQPQPQQISIAFIKKKIVLPQQKRIVAPQQKRNFLPQQNNMKASFKIAPSAKPQAVQNLDLKSLMQNDNFKTAMSQLSQVKIPYKPAYSTKKLYKRGLRNLGNTCYINCVLMQLYLCKQIREYFKNTQTYQLSAKLCKIFTCIDQQQEQSFRRNINLLKQHLGPPFNNGHQQDSHQFLIKLIETAEQQSKEAKESQLSFRQLFYYCVMPVVICLKNLCQKTSRPQRQFCLIVNFPQHETTLSEMIKRSRIQRLQQFTCEKCNQKQMTKKQYVDVAGAKFMLVAISMVEKREVRFLIDQRLRMFERDYNLVGFTAHRGYLQFGHYIYYHRIGKDTWHIYNDEIVEEMTISKGRVEDYMDGLVPYIVLYKQD